VTTTLAIADQEQLAPVPALPTPKRRYGRLVWTVLNFALMLGIIGGSIYYGLMVRRMAWEYAYQVHFHISLNNAIKWGHYSNKVGYLKVYEKIIEEDGDDLNQDGPQGQLALDYPPLRLLIMSKWEAWTEEHFPQNRNWSARWRNEYEFNRPVLQLNTACEFAGAVAMFLLVHYWLRQCSGAPARQWIDPLRCAWPALFSALLVWFSPALIYNAHSYPQWDAWILAPFLLAVYFGMLDLWLISGILIGVVSMGKGQILIVTPVLVIWQLGMLPGGEIVRLIVAAVRAVREGDPIAPPLLQALRLVAIPFGAALRLGVGIVLAMGLVASPWLVSSPISLHWTIWVAGALGCLIPLFFLRKWTATDLYTQAGLLLVALCMVLWPWVPKGRPDYFGYAFLAVIGFAIAARFLPWRWAFSWTAAAIAGAIFACVPLFNTSMAWYTIGIKFPTQHWQVLYWCKAMNLGAILQEDFHWKFADTIDLTDYLPFLHSVDPITASVGDMIIPMRYLMITAYLIALVICGIAMAIQYRRRDRMFFFAMVAPWFLMFALLPQMQNRYSLWAAVFAAATASFSLDGLMLFVLLNALNGINTAVDMLRWAKDSDTSQKWLPLIGPMFPDLAWASMLLAGIYLYLALCRDRRNKRIVRLPGPSIPPTLPPLAGPGRTGFDVVTSQPAVSAAF
jgi:hypothetical protein